MNSVVKILMERDNMSYKEALEVFKDVQDQVYELLQNNQLDEVEEFIMDELGLEPDYIIDLL